VDGKTTLRVATGYIRVILERYMRATLKKEFGKALVLFNGALEINIMGNVILYINL